MNQKLLFDNVLLQDTSYHYPDDKVAWLDCFGISSLIFGIVNETNKDVSVQPIGRAGGAMGNLGSATNISANSEGVVTLNLSDYWAPYVAVSLKASTTPTGRITVYAVWRNGA